MKTHKLLSALGIYITFLFIGHHGPFAHHRHADDHAHTHKKHVAKLLRIEEDSELSVKLRKYIPLTT